MAIQTVKTGAAVNDGTGDDARTAFTKINQNFTDNSHAASRLVGTDAGNVMEVGAFGLGGNSPPIFPDNFAKQKISKTGFYYTLPSATAISDGQLIFINRGYWLNGIYFPVGDAAPRLLASNTDRTDWSVNEFLVKNVNTWVDGNGSIKAASPIVSLYADKIECNDEAAQQDITFEKLGVGDYLIKGSTGFAQEGWYIETPKDANGNVLVAVVYEQLANNDISVKTYDYMLNKKGRIVPDLETPLDIPETRWIDLRLQALPQPDIKPFATDQTDATNAE